MRADAWQGNPGVPAAPASSFTVGTQRKGVDGEMYEVDLPPGYGGRQMWCPVETKSTKRKRGGD